MYTIERRVGVSQTDKNGRLSLRGALDYIIDCCLFQVEALEEFGEFLRRNSFSMFQVHIQADIRRMPAYGEKLAISTSIYECRNFYGFRNTMIRDEAGKVCLATYATGAFVNLKTARPEKLSPEVIASIKFDPQEEMEYLPRKIALPADGVWTAGTARAVSANMLDMNGHMNSNWYVSLAEEMLPDDLAWNRLRIEYKQQSRQNEIIHPAACRKDADTLAVKIEGEDAAPHAVLEFSRF